MSLFLPCTAFFTVSLFLLECSLFLPDYQKRCVEFFYCVAFFTGVFAFFTGLLKTLCSIFLLCRFFYWIVRFFYWTPKNVV